jgi:DNA-binding transcriptional ArsR family regulator
MVPENESDITDVLKSLNHEIRRKIIRILHEKQLVPYSDFLYKLDLPASSNVAYHISLLTKTQLIRKDSDGKYFLTSLGRRSALLLDLAKESKTTSFSDIYLAFSLLNSIEILFGTWYIFFFIFGFYLLQKFLFIGIIFILMSISSIVLIIYRTRTLWTLLLINNFIWIFFIPDKREILISITLTNVFGLILLIPDADIIVFTIPFQIILGWILVLTSLILSFIYLYISSGRNFQFISNKRS